MMSKKKIDWGKPLRLNDDCAIPVKLVHISNRFGNVLINWKHPKDVNEEELYAFVDWDGNLIKTLHLEKDNYDQLGSLFVINMEEKDHVLVIDKGDDFYAICNSQAMTESEAIDKAEYYRKNGTTTLIVKVK